MRVRQSPIGDAVKKVGQWSARGRARLSLPVAPLSAGQVAKIDAQLFLLRPGWEVVLAH